jgi:ATP-binding cassette subfamily C protein
MGMLPTAVMLFTSVFVLATGALLVIFGTITQGTLAAFFLLLSGFLAPLIILVPSIDSFLSLRGSLDSIDDILMQKVDPALRDPYLDTEPAPLEIYAATMSESVEPAPLEVKDSPVSEAEVEVDHLSLLMAQGGRKRGQKSGVSSGLAVDPWAASLDLVDVTFGYSRINAPLLNNITLSIKPGRVVALVGASGSGKSTVGRLVASMYQPWQGEISLDGKPLQSISQESKANDINFVNQDVVIFQASIRDNISMFNPDIPDRNIVAAAKKALIHDDIISRPGGYEAVLAQDGRDLSGGQRQRLGIARALVRNPRLLVLDEATSSLDARTEMEIVANLRAQGCTSLVIAHRLSTVRDADEIIVMDQGRIMERGTHRELALQGGPYQELMNS